MKLSEEQIAEALGPGLFGETCVDRAIAALKMYEPPEGYRLSFSGGKDSIVLKRLADEAEVKYDAHYAWTTCDPPELLQYIRQHHGDVDIERPAKTMWQLIEKRGLPSRKKRFCCEELKERAGRGRMVLTGLRGAESPRRMERIRRMGGGVVEVCQKDSTQRFVHPMADWSDIQVWAFIHDRKLPYCSLYDEGFKRLGCVICPMTDVTDQSLNRWPKLWSAAYRASKRYYDSHDTPKKQWSSIDAYWAWWLRRPFRDDDDSDCIGLFSAGMEE